MIVSYSRIPGGWAPWPLSSSLSKYLASHRPDACGPRSWRRRAHLVGKGSARQGLDSACKCQMYCANRLPIEGATPNFHCLASERSGAAMLHTPPELGRDGAGASHPLRPIEMPSPAIASPRRARTTLNGTLERPLLHQCEVLTRRPSPASPPSTQRTTDKSRQLSRDCPGPPYYSTFTQ